MINLDCFFPLFKHPRSIFQYFILFVAITSFPSWIKADTSLSPLYSILAGGRLYDNWISRANRSNNKSFPTKTHPAYPEKGKKKGWVTWRCKECHGWDYKGVKGNYGQGSHYTGIKGIQNFKGKSSILVTSIIRDNNHQYTVEMISKQEAEQLALFVVSGQINLDQYIESDTLKVQANPDRGKEFFQTICAHCHGLDGKKINFHINQSPEYVGNIAQENPWELFHKIRNGQPSQKMVSLGVLPLQDLLDIIAYAQTLPTD